MGRLIPAGTGMEYYRNFKVASDPTMHEAQAEEEDDTPIYLEAMAAINARAQQQAASRDAVEETEFEETEEVAEDGFEENFGEESFEEEAMVEEDDF